MWLHSQVLCEWLVPIIMLPHSLQALREISEVGDQLAMKTSRLKRK